MISTWSPHRLHMTSVNLLRHVGLLFSDVPVRQLGGINAIVAGRPGRCMLDVGGFEWVYRRWRRCRLGPACLPCIAIVRLVCAAGTLLVASAADASIAPIA
jgi:hypothetical protein